MKRLFVPATLLCAASLAWAQDTGVATATEQTSANSAAVSAAPATEAKATPVVILNQQSVAAKADMATAQPVVVAQPVATIESTPLSGSRADQMREARQRAEYETEQRIAEKLEESRIADEKRRLGDLFNASGAAAATAAAPAATAPAAAQPQVIVVTQPAPQTTTTAPAVSADDVRSVVRDELKAATAASSSVSAGDVVKAKALRHQNYAFGQLGVADYDAINVETTGAFGFGFGREFDSNWVAELDFGYSKHFIDETYWVYRTMQQYNTALMTRFVFELGAFRPHVGAGVSYTYRDYSEPRQAYGPSYEYMGSVNSSALDFALSAGLQLKLSQKFMLGVEYRYYQNVTYWYSDDEELNRPAYRDYGYWGASPLEDADYEVWGFNMIYTF